MTLLFMLALAHPFSQATADAPLTLQRTFTKGLKSEYMVSASLHTESRQQGLVTFLPEDEDISYRFFTRVLDVTPAGAVVRYSRPSISDTGGETLDSGPKTSVEKLDQIFEMTLSPINEMLDFKDLTPKKKKKPGDDEQPKDPNSDDFAGAKATARQGAFLGQYIGEVERLCLFIGGLDTSMDFAPKLNVAPVKVGDSWKRTVSYQPQKLKSKDGKTVVQRLDLVYTYKGIVDSNGKKVYRVHADLKLDTDLGTYFNQVVDAKPEDTGLKSIPLKLTSSMDFDLDLKTAQTIHGEANSTAGFQIFTTQSPDAVEEVKLKGETVMSLLKNTAVAAPGPHAVLISKGN